MQIIIKGKRGEGKTTVARLIETVLTSFIVFAYSNIKSITTHEVYPSTVLKDNGPGDVRIFVVNE